MDILRDSLWQGIGAIFTILAFIAFLIVERDRLLNPSVGGLLAKTVRLLLAALIPGFAGAYVFTLLTRQPLDHPAYRSNLSAIVGLLFLATIAGALWGKDKYERTAFLSGLVTAGIAAITDLASTRHLEPLDRILVSAGDAALFFILGALAGVLYVFWGRVQQS